MPHHFEISLNMVSDRSIILRLTSDKKIIPKVEFRDAIKLLKLKNASTVEEKDKLLILKIQEIENNQDTSRQFAAWEYD